MFLLCFCLCGVVWASAEEGKREDPNFDGVYLGECNDFLTALELKPDFVEFVECRFQQDKQGAPMTAFYHVSGSHALEAEKFAMDSFGMPPLRMICCYWGMGREAIFYMDRQTGIHYYVNMHSEETVHGQREEWGQIEFYITVDVYTEAI